METLLFAVNSISDMAREYEQEGHHLGRGLWSFVLMPTPEDDRRFFDLYSDHLNQSAATYWHCVGFVRRQTPASTKDKGWRSDAGLHQLSNQVRGAIRGELIAENQAALVFFNPLSKLDESRVCVVRLDASRLHEQEFYKEGLNRVTGAVTSTLQRDLDYAVQTEYTIDERLRSLEHKLSGSLLRGVSTAAFSIAVPVFMKMFIEHGARAVGLR
jgi:hypothetical protein